MDKYIWLVNELIQATRMTNFCTDFELNRIKNANAIVQTYTYILHTYIYTYIYKVFNDHSKRVLGVMIGTHFALPGLGVAMMANRIAHFYKWKFAKKYIWADNSRGENQIALDLLLDPKQNK